MKFVFAQGNPGSEYAGTRHNIGFMVLDTLAAEYEARFAAKSKFHADIAEVDGMGEKILLIKPTTFYNETGRSARALADFYKFSPSDELLVIHDDLALPFGMIRIRRKGSDAGNNGIKSLNASIGEDYGRIRIGICPDPRGPINDIDFVLGRFTGEEHSALVSSVIPKAIEHTKAFLAGNLEDTSHSLL